MSQDPYPNFQTSQFESNGLYQTDMQMQFAASVPPRSTPTHNMNFSQGSFPHQEMMPPLASQFSLNYPTSPYERSDASCTTNTMSGKQVQSKAERRAEHNAIERARRESLNVKFQQLAFTLPNLQNDTRPSKSTIIDRTLDFVKGAILKEERMNYRIKELEKFSRYLLSELDKKSAEPTSPLSSPVAVHEKMSPQNEMMPPRNEMMLQQQERRPVSRLSVPTVPKSEITNWPTTFISPTTDQFQQNTQPIQFQKFDPARPIMMNDYDSNYMMNYMEPNHGLPRR